MKNYLSSSKSLKKKFSKVFEANGFHGDQSLSGRGSDLDQTRTIELEIPKVLEEFQIKSVLDVPCGDQNWIQRINFEGIDYVGADIVSALIHNNDLRFGSENKIFITLDLSHSVPPKKDLILCRDLLVHLNTKSIERCISNIKASGSRYLLSTTFTDARPYKDLPFLTRGIGWRPINLEQAPFFFPKPLMIINENCTEGENLFADKSLGLWRIQDL
jgi:2-polyprenyl-3-methyl-5-hydroxy-6-metoxy-1,4-benzoquinol methylase